ncbi:hypothetical protein HTZ77_12985 [Nonomuraea sp. SMC257]|uniref:Uncharacterized protein n=1 Tax=Nonomuraea montanisoli TaxID=2741721 RepID=A0A7Y6I6A4_9ACTN|nr:hypothetical protein [Nonomuraea montanisoli]NUW32339.1 hypothetical protein [Nonomuraea montanisoli]
MSRHFYRVRWRGAVYVAAPEPHSLELWVRLRSPEPVEGFEQVEPGCHVRTVPVTECDGLEFVSTVCRWRGERFDVHDERDGKLLLEYLGGSALTARELGLERVERGVYRLWVPASEVTGLHQEAVRLDIGHHRN